MVKLFSKNSNLSDHNPPTSQTDGQTDDMRSQDRALHYSASHSKKTAVLTLVYAMSEDDDIVMMMRKYNKRIFAFSTFNWCHRYTN